jgi:hypothetical protein
MTQPNTTLLLAALLAAGPALAADDHDAAPMMAPADAPMTQEAFDEANEEDDARTASPEDILARFQAAFEGNDNPRMAVFWNSELPSRVSDWRSNRRAVLGISGEAEGTEEGQPTDMEGKVAISAQAEYRNDQARKQAEETAFALQSGLIETFRQGEATVIDQAMAQRLTDNELEDGTFSRLSPDQLRLQMRALSKHADYVLELTTAPDFEEEETYRVRVLSVDNASVVAMFESKGQPPEDEREEKWVATDSGYQKKERPVSLKEVGRELALQTMERMAK